MKTKNVQLYKTAFNNTLYLIFSALLILSFLIISKAQAATAINYCAPQQFIDLKDRGEKAHTHGGLLLGNASLLGYNVLLASFFANEGSTLEDADIRITDPSGGFSSKPYQAKHLPLNNGKAEFVIANGVDAGALQVYFPDFVLYTFVGTVNPNTTIAINAHAKFSEPQVNQVDPVLYDSINTWSEKDVPYTECDTGITATEIQPIGGAGLLPVGN